MRRVISHGKEIFDKNVVGEAREQASRLPSCGIPSDPGHFLTGEFRLVFRISCSVVLGFVLMDSGYV